MAETIALAVSKKNDLIDIELGAGNTYIIPPSKGNDSLNFSFVEDMNGGKFEYIQAEESKDLHIIYTKGDVTDTIIINDYFKTLDGKATSSSVKTVNIDGETYNLADLYKYIGPFTPDKKRNVAGTVFSDVIDESGYRNDQKKGLTIKAGDGNDVITGSRYNDTITGGKGYNTVVLQDTFGDDKLVTTKGETVNLSYDGSVDKLEYVLDGKNVKAVANKPDITYCLKAMLSISKPMELPSGYYCTVKSQVVGAEQSGITIKIYTPDEIDEFGMPKDGVDGIVKTLKEKSHTYFYVVEDGEGGYKWQSEDLLAGLSIKDNDGKTINIELRVDTTPIVDDRHPDRLEDLWTDTGNPDNYNYHLTNSNVYRVEDKTEINISKEVTKLLNSGEYDASLYYGREIGLHGSVSITGMASKELTADVLVNGTNLEEYLSTEGYLNVKGEKKLTGTRFNDRFVGSEFNDTITGKLGNNLYDIDTSKDFGDDTVVLTKGETMTLSFDKDNYKTSDLKYELVNGGKDIKISSNVDTSAPASGVSYEIRGKVHLTFVEFEDPEIDIIEADYDEFINIVYRMVKDENGEYKWLSDNIMKDFKPDAPPIRLELSLTPPTILEGSSKDFPDGIFSDDFRSEDGGGYPYGEENEFEIHQTGYETVMVEAFEFEAYKITNGKESIISSALNQEVVDGVYYPKNYMDEEGLQLSNFDGTVTLKNYGQKDLGATVKIGDSDLEKYLKTDGVVEVSGKGTIKSTRFNDNILGSASADKIYTYAGNDTVNAGKGNDKIYLDDGNKTLTFKSGDGNDIIYSAKSAKSVDLQIAETEFDNMEFSRKGNNLVITRIDNDGKTVKNKALSTLYLTEDGELTNVKKGNTKVGKTLYSYEVDGENGTKITKYSTTEVEGGTDVSNRQFFLENGKVVPANSHTEALSETITIDGYFKDATNITLNGEDLITSNDKVKYSGSGKVTFGDDGYNYDITTGKKNDTITLDGGDNIVSSGAGNDKVTIHGDGNNILNYTAGKDTYAIGAGNDTYNVDFGNKTNLIISDNGGSDILNLSTTGDITCLFNVDKDGNIVTDSSLLIYDTDSLSRSNKKVLSGGKVEISDYFSSGKIETINKNDTVAFDASSIDAIKSDVATWLNANGYDNTMQAIASCDNEQYAKLIEIYQGIS